MTWQTWFRFSANWFLPIVLLVTYLHAMFFDPTKFVGDQSPTVPGSIPKETWAAMSPTAKGLGPQLGGWAICYAMIVAGFLYFEPTELVKPLEVVPWVSGLEVPPGKAALLDNLEGAIKKFLVSVQLCL